MKRNTMINTIIAATTLCVGFLIGYDFKKHNIKDKVISNCNGKLKKI